MEQSLGVIDEEVLAQPELAQGALDPALYALEGDSWNPRMIAGRLSEFEAAAAKAEIICTDSMRLLRRTNFLEGHCPAAEFANYFRARQLVRDCIELCASTARLSAKRSPMTGSIAHACEDCCRECVAARRWLQTEGPADWIGALRQAADVCCELARQSRR